MTEHLLPVDDDPLTEPFWAGCRRGELLVQRFVASGRLVWPPRPMDPHSRSFDHEWVPVSGAATVWSYVVPHPPLLSPYAEQAPFNVVVVALDDDPSIRMVGNLVARADAALDSIDPHSIEIGEPVRVVFSRVGDMVLPQWARAS